MGIARLAGVARRTHRVLGHLHGVALLDGPHSDFHEPSIPEEPVVVRGVAVAVCQPPEYAWHVRAKPPEGAHVSPAGGGPGEGVGVVQLPGVVEHECGQHVLAQGQYARETRLHGPE